MKIIFISRPTYFTPMRERLFLKNEIDKYEIEYWSTYYLYNKVNPYSYLQLDNQEKIKTIIFKREKDLLKKVFEMNKKDIVIISEEIDYINYKFFKELYKKNIKIIFFFPENIPDIRSNEKKVKKIILYLKKPKIFFQKLYIKLKKQFYKYKILKLKEKMEDAIFLISGKKKEEEIKKQFNNKKNKFIPIMSRDLIKYREANYSLEDNIVFIDQYLPYHPDFKLRKTKSVEPISYYKYLNDFFTKIEKNIIWKL